MVEELEEEALLADILLQLHSPHRHSTRLSWRLEEEDPLELMVDWTQLHPQQESNAEPIQQLLLPPTGVVEEELR